MGRIPYIQYGFTNISNVSPKQHAFLTVQWWVLLIALIIPIFLWLRIVDKKRIKEILLYGLFVSFLITYIDAIGLEMSFWSYPITLVPVFTWPTPWDISVFPVICMIIYQYSEGWKPYFIIHFIADSIISFIGIPLLVLSGFYKLAGWNYFFPWIVLIGVAVLAKVLIDIEKPTRLPDSGRIDTVGLCQAIMQTGCNTVIQYLDLHFICSGCRHSCAKQNNEAKNTCQSFHVSPSK
ncbi:MAG TPA: CBO0543 family protein [Clostridia bacterium]|nr:CBO0543 family protein [Clostridia bacterium]